MNEETRDRLLHLQAESCFYGTIHFNAGGFEPAQRTGYVAYGAEMTLVFGDVATLVTEQKRTGIPTHHIYYIEYDA